MIFSEYSFETRVLILKSLPFSDFLGPMLLSFQHQSYAILTAITFCENFLLNCGQFGVCIFYFLLSQMLINASSEKKGEFYFRSATFFFLFPCTKLLTPPIIAIFTAPGRYINSAKNGSKCKLCMAYNYSVL